MFRRFDPEVGYIHKKVTLPVLNCYGYVFLYDDVTLSGANSESMLELTGVLDVNLSITPPGDPHWIEQVKDVAAKIDLAVFDIADSLSDALWEEIRICGSYLPPDRILFICSERVKMELLEGATDDTSFIKEALALSLEPKNSIRELNNDVRGRIRAVTSYIRVT